MKLGKMKLLARIEALEGEMENVGVWFKGHADRLERLEKACAFEVKTPHLIDQLDRRIEFIEARMKNAEPWFTDVVNRLDRIERRIEESEAKPWRGPFTSKVTLTPMPDDADEERRPEQKPLEQSVPPEPLSKMKVTDWMPVQDLVNEMLDHRSKWPEPHFKGADTERMKAEEQQQQRWNKLFEMITGWKLGPTLHRIDPVSPASVDISMPKTTQEALERKSQPDHRPIWSEETLSEYLISEVRKNAEARQRAQERWPDPELITADEWQNILHALECGAMEGQSWTSKEFEAKIEKRRDAARRRELGVKHDPA
jgi:hypothetical protein